MTEEVSRGLSSVTKAGNIDLRSLISHAFNIRSLLTQGIERGILSNRIQDTRIRGVEIFLKD